MIEANTLFGIIGNNLPVDTRYSLGVFERKILRRMYGPICEGTTWRSRYNEELYRLYDKTDLVTSIRIT
jgi:hypothetical protein